MNWYVKCMRKYADFGGRARREEYWMFFVFNMLFMLAAGAVDGVVSAVIGMPISLFLSLYSLAVFVPSIAVAVRRLHDTGRSGWLFLLVFVPVGNIVLIVFLATEGVRSANCYGGDPKGTATIITDFNDSGFGGGGNDLIL